MNISSRLFYHLQQKEEQLDSRARELERVEHDIYIQKEDVALSKKEQEAMFRVMKEKMEVIQLLFQTKLENLTSLLQLKDVLHQTALDNRMHESQVKDLINADKLDRQKDIYEHQKILDTIDHHRELLDLDHTIATKTQEIHILEQDIQHLTHVGELKDQEMSIVKEQNIFERRRRELVEETNRQQQKFYDWKEEHLEKIEELKKNALSLQKQANDIDFDRKEIDIQQREKDIEREWQRMEDRKYSHSVLMDTEWSKLDAAKDRFEAESTKEALDTRYQYQLDEIQQREDFVEAKSKMLSQHRRVFNEMRKSEQERFRFWRNYSEHAKELEYIKEEQERANERLHDILAEHQQVAQSKKRLEAEKKTLESSIEAIKKELPEGKK